MKPADRFPGLIADRWDPLPPSLRFPGLIADRWDDADLPVHTTAQFANPWHDELGRFAPKNTGRRVPTKGIVDDEMPIGHLEVDADRLGPDTIPALPGTTPIGPNQVRLYHRTSSLEALEAIRAGGLKVAAGRGETYGEPNAVWGSARLKDFDPQRQHFIEFVVDWEDIVDRFDVIGGPSSGTNPPWTPESWMARGGNIALPFDVPTSSIVAIHEPWHEAYRQLADPLVKEGVLAGHYDNLADDPMYGKAMKRIREELGMPPIVASGALYQFRNPYKDERGRFTDKDNDADGAPDYEIDHDPDFPVKEGFKRVFTHSARLRAAKERGVSIPPGWRNTQVSKDPDAPGLRARGVDAAGRVQPRYSRDHIESASAEKYQRILSFQTRYAERLDDHLREDAETDPTAGAVVLMRRMGLRPGSTADTRAKVQAYGATTLEARHVKFLPDGVTVKLDFTGKKGVRIQLSTKDKLVYRTLLAHTAGKKPGERIFQTTSDRTNAYLTRVLPDDAPKFTNRDLRTILGTGFARRMTRRMPIPRTAAENRRARKKVAERVARILGNEPGEALRSYIAPEVFDAAGW